LVYEIKIDKDNKVKISMTLTSPNCPAAESLPGEVEFKVQQVPGVSDVDVEIVWDPPWTADLMSDAAKLELGFM
jgi:metal-sulfur cluster biosynthetic enzyme